MKVDVKMKEYIIVHTFCNKENIAHEIVNILLEKNLVASSQISKVHSKYWWNNKLEECDEFKLEFRTKKNLFYEIEKEIKKIHDYEIAEISSSEISEGNNEFIKWIDNNTK